MAHANPTRFFDTVDPVATPQQRVAQIRQAYRYFQGSCMSDESCELPEADYCLLRLWVRDADGAVRAVAVAILLQGTTVTWDDLLEWLQDTCEDVRTATLRAMSDRWLPVGQCCAADKPRCAQLLMDTADRYADMAVSAVFRDLIEEDSAWLPMLWPGVERLLDENRADLNSMIGCGFLEHFLPEQQWGADSPYLAAWMTGNHHARQYVLLKVAAWMGLHEGRLREITQALTKAHDPKIREIATGILKGKIAYADF